MAIGLVSGAMGPLSNAPIDTIKTRLQKTPSEPGDTAVSRVVRISKEMWKQEGSRSFYKGITPRIMRVGARSGGHVHRLRVFEEGVGAWEGDVAWGEV